MERGYKEIINLTGLKLLKSELRNQSIKYSYNEIGPEYANYASYLSVCFFHFWSHVFSPSLFLQC